MPSTYSTNLKIELQANGENSTTWGTITNTNLGTALEQAIVGYGNPSFPSDANLTLSYTDTNAAQAARALVLNVTSAVSLTNTRELVVPTIQKQYIVQNNTTGSQSITVKTSAGSGITVPNGRKAHLYVNGTDVIYMDDYVDINGGSIDGTTIGGSSAAAGTFTTLGATTGNITTVNATTVDTTNIEVTNIKAKDGTSAATIADSTGVISLTANPTLSAGTANGVLYLNGSKVATSGSALTFDGTDLATTGGVRLNNAQYYYGKNAAGSAVRLLGVNAGNVNYVGAIDSGPTELNYGSASTVTTHAWNISGTGAMALTSTGLGIGTASPAAKLDVNGTIYSRTGGVYTDTLTAYSGSSISVNAGSSNFAVTVNGSERLRIDSSGNLGIGTASPSSFGKLAAVAATTTTALYAGTGTQGVFISADDSTRMVTYASSGSLIGGHRWLYGNTEGMRLDSSAGNLGIGTASPGFKLDVQGSATDFVAFNGLNTNNNAGTITSSAIKFGFTSTVGTHYATLKITEDSVNSNSGGLTISLPNGGVETPLLALTSAGNLGIGTTSPGYKLSVAGASGSAVLNLLETGVRSWGIRAGGTATNTFDIADFTAGATRLTIDSSGNLGLGVTPSAWGNYKAFQISASGHSLAATGAGSGDLTLAFNAFYDSTDSRWEYVYTGDKAGRYSQTGAGNHVWYTTNTSGTAGNEITDFATAKMTLTALGQLELTAAAPRLAIAPSTGTNSAFTHFVNSASANFSYVGIDSSVGGLGTGGYSMALWHGANYPLVFGTNNTERGRFTAGGSFVVGKTTIAFGGTEGFFAAYGDGSDLGFATQSYQQTVGQINREGNDGELIIFYQAGTQEGDISVNGTTVSYNGGHLSRWSQTLDNTRIPLLKGTVMSNLDQMAVWEKDGQPLPNEQLNCMKVSDVEGDVNVAGVFVNWDNDDDVYTNDMNIAMTGDMIIRIAQGVVVQRGDLLMSAGDGTAKPQGDDIIRSKTIAKVISNHVTCTYEDGSYCVPCVLMAC